MDIGHTVEPGSLLLPSISAQQVSTCISKTKATYIFTYFRCRRCYSLLKNVHLVLALIITRHSSRSTQSPDNFAIQSREKTPWWERTALCCCCSPPTEPRWQPIRKQCGSRDWSSKQTLTLVPATFATRLPPQESGFYWHLWMCS